jgi:hypothetical protein
MSFARLVPMKDNSIALYSDYDPGLVADLKSIIPYNARKWNPEDKSWRIAPQYAQKVADIVYKNLGIRVDLPTIAAKPKSITKLIKLEYLGAAKDRGNGEPSSFGWVDGKWSVIFPLSVLRNWFEPGEDTRPDEMPTLYGVLGLPRDAKGIDIKTAYRRAARTWHPDVCNEPDATSQFRRIKEAYEILSSLVQRSKYDAGLKLVASLRHDHLPKFHKAVAHWRPPLRCGYLLVEGTEQLGRIVVSRIHQWEDIVDIDKNGWRVVMVSYWPRNTDHFEVKWI